MKMHRICFLRRLRCSAHGGREARRPLMVVSWSTTQPTGFPVCVTVQRNCDPAPVHRVSNVLVLRPHLHQRQ